MSKIPTLTVPLGRGANALRKWTAGQLKAGVPRGVLYLSILQSPQPSDFDEMLAWRELEREIGGIMVNRNLEGRVAEKAGATEQELAETTLIAAALRAGGAVTHGTHTLE